MGPNCHKLVVSAGMKVYAGGCFKPSPLHKMGQARFAPCVHMAKPAMSLRSSTMLCYGPCSGGLTPGQPLAVPAQQVSTYAGSIGHTDICLSWLPCDFWRNELSWQLGDTGPAREEPRLDPGTGQRDQQWEHMCVISQCTETPFGAILFTEAFFPYFINLNIEDSFSPPQFSCKPFSMRLPQHCWE